MIQETFEGVIERITYYNEETGYSVLRIKPHKPRLGQVGPDGLATVVGVMPELHEGEAVRFTGAWDTHPEYGRQFKAESAQQTAPATLDGLRRYLGGGLIKGVGPALARRIVDHFGMKTLDILNEQPELLLEVQGIKKKHVEAIAEKWAEQRSIQNVMLFLQTHRVSTALAVKIFKTYGDEAITQVREDPYRLARDVQGIGFKTADQIAQNLGLAWDDPGRIAAGVSYALDTLAEDGHVYAPREALLSRVPELLELPYEEFEDKVNTAIERRVREGEVHIEMIPVDDENQVEAVYLRPMYYSEKGAARRLLNMIETGSSRLRGVKTLNWEQFFTDLSDEGQTQLTEQQREAVHAALTHKVSILTGGPGTGKTTTLRAVIQALEKCRGRYALASPTGRAAKRLSEATGQPARTIHRLLGYAPGEGFLFNEDYPLDVDMLIIDEASMLDLGLFYSVLKALTPETHLMLVGDVDQLPSVGAGDVLRDLIRSEVVHVTRLDAIFRQASDSLIIANAHRINKGQTPDLTNQGEDFFLFTSDGADSVADLVVDVVQNRIPKRFGLHPLNDVQVLAPMYRGNVGIQALNEKLQAALNPPGRLAEQTIGSKRLRVGDKVLQTKNNYEKEVYNGDIGRIYSIDFTEKQLGILFDGRLVEYEWSEVDELVHAFAVSVHRSQGSEYPAVVLPMVTQHYMMLQRNLLYTAVTRAQKLVVLVGTRRAIEMAVRNDKVARRFSGLAWRLGKKA